VQYADRSKRNVTRAVEDLQKLASPLAHWLSHNTPTYPWAQPPGAPAQPGGSAHQGHTTDGDSSGANAAGDVPCRTRGPRQWLSWEGIPPAMRRGKAQWRGFLQGRRGGLEGLTRPL